MSIVFGETRQLGCVVRDADAAIAQWAKVGVGPFFKVTCRIDDFRYRGAPSDAPEVTLCFAFSGHLQIELIQQHNDVPSAYRDFLAAGGDGAQHVSSWFGDPAAYDRARAAMCARGFRVAHEGVLRYAGSRIVYFETGLPGAMMVEMSEALLHNNGERLAMMEDAARTWDGKTLIQSERSLL